MSIGTMICKGACFLALMAGLSQGAEGADCDPPAYRVAPRAGEQLERIVIAPRDLTRANLDCLARTFKKRVKSSDAGALIFTSEVAALNVDLSGMVTGLYSRELRAIYSLKVTNDERSETLMITPFGMNVDALAFAAVTDLGLGEQVRCELEWSGRCLWAAGEMRFPVGPIQATSVTLWGTLGRDGKVTNIQTAASNFSPAASPLIQSAIDNLTTWWFEAAATEQHFEATYSFRVDPSLPFGRAVDVRFGPHKVSPWP